jgi:hypothetical protein
MTLWGSHYCDRCERDHAAMEVCPLAPGYFELMRLWSAGERDDLMTWGALLVTLVIVFGLAMAAFTTPYR